MTNRPHSHLTGELAQQAIEHTITKEAGWVAEPLHKDYGEDLHVRIYKDGRATPLSFFVQVKSSKTATKRGGESYISVKVKTSHLRHWNGFLEPVFVVFHDAKTGANYWESVHYYLDLVENFDLLESGRKWATMRIPVANRLDAEGLKRMLVITKKRSSRYANATAGAQVLLDLLVAAGVEVIHHAPQEGMLMVKEPNGEIKVHMFGLFERLVRAVDPSGRWVIDAAVDAAERILKTKEQGDAEDGLQLDGYDAYLYGDGHALGRRLWELTDIEELVSDAEAHENGVLLGVEGEMPARRKGKRSPAKSR